MDLNWIFILTLLLVGFDIMVFAVFNKYDDSTYLMISSMLGIALLFFAGSFGVNTKLDHLILFVLLCASLIPFIWLGGLLKNTDDDLMAVKQRNGTMNRGGGGGAMNANSYELTNDRIRSEFQQEKALVNEITSARDTRYAQLQARDMPVN